MLRLLQWASWLLQPAGAAVLGRAVLQRRLEQPAPWPLGMDVPVSLGIAVTFIASSGATFDPGGIFGHEVYFDSLTMFVFFLLGGRWLELRARHKVALSLEAGTARLPDSVERLRPDGGTELVAIARLAAGDRVRVAAGQTFRPTACCSKGAAADEACSPANRAGGQAAGRRTGGGQPEPARAGADAGAAPRRGTRARPASWR